MESMAYLIRRTVGGLLVLELVWIDSDILRGRRFAHAPIGKYSIACLAALVFVMAIVAIVSRDTDGADTGSIRRSLATAPAILLSLAFWGPPLSVWWQRRQKPPEVPRAEADGIAVLRELSSAQEQYRLRFGKY